MTSKTLLLLLIACLNAGIIGYLIVDMKRIGKRRNTVRFTKLEKQTIQWAEVLTQARPDEDLVALIPEAQQWAQVRLPEERRKALIHAGIAPYAALHPSTMSLTEADLNVMTALRTSVNNAA